MEPSQERRGEADAVAEMMRADAELGRRLGLPPPEVRVDPASLPRGVHWSWWLAGAALIVAIAVGLRLSAQHPVTSEPIVVAPIVPVPEPIPAAEPSEPAAPAEEPLPVVVPVVETSVATLVPPAVPAAPPPVVAAPAPSPEPLERIDVDDGRRFIGTYEAGTISVRAVVRGTVVTRMPPSRVHVAPERIVARVPYGGEAGDLSAPFVPEAPDPARAAALDEARARVAAEARARREAAALAERREAHAAQRQRLVADVSAAEAAVAGLRERDQVLAGRAATQEADRVAAQQLVQGVQLQLNTANDRWNLEVQQLGPRKRLPDGSWGGGPTPATELLVRELTQQLRAARAQVDRLARQLTDDATERRRIARDLPERERGVTEAQAAVAEFDRQPAP